MTLNEQTRALFEGLRAKAPAALVDQLLAIFARLERAHVGADAPAVGAMIPAARLTRVDGSVVDVRALVAVRPTVLLFFRGRWCPFCDLTLRAFEQISPELARAGAQLIAASPQTTAETARTREERGLTFELLSDPRNAAAQAFGLQWALTEDEQALYRMFAADLEQANGDASWTLPAPAAFVIDGDGIVRWSYVNPDHTQRPEPADVLAAVRTIMPAMVVRISKGKFQLERLAEAEQLLAQSEQALRGALTALDGLLHYYVGIDREQGYLTNVSIWRSLEAAHQLDRLQEMLAQRPILEAAGVKFETISNHETLWTIGV